MSSFPYIYTFYSFKGGVGRTMALVNVAYTLAARGRNVLLVDFDLEAPGLSVFLQRGDELEGVPPRDGLDLLAWAKGQFESIDTSIQASRLDYVVSVRPDKLDCKALRPQLGELGRVDVIPLHFDRDYTDRLAQTAMNSFSREELVETGRVLHRTFKSWRWPIDVPEYLGPEADQFASYDYVLIDSRTGFSEMGGLCVGPLSDFLVVLTSLNEQNVEMTKRFLLEVGLEIPGESQESKNQSNDPGAPILHFVGPKKTLLVASPLPVGEGSLRRERLEELGRRIAAHSVFLTYHPRQALMETIFVRDWSEEHLAAEYNALADQMMALIDDHAMQLYRNVQNAWNQREKLSEVLEAIIRLKPSASRLGRSLDPTILNPNHSCPLGGQPRPDP